ncbi:MAG: hypothetical protein ABI537_16220, partial [Casimicrobiaceae bacterium]
MLVAIRLAGVEHCAPPGTPDLLAAGRPDGVQPDRVEEALSQRVEIRGDIAGLGFADAHVRHRVAG